MDLCARKVIVNVDLHSAIWYLSYATRSLFLGILNMIGCSFVLWIWDLSSYFYLYVVSFISRDSSQPVSARIHDVCDVNDLQNLHLFFSLRSAHISYTQAVNCCALTVSFHRRYERQDWEILFLSQLSRDFPIRWRHMSSWARAHHWVRATVSNVINWIRRENFQPEYREFDHVLQFHDSIVALVWIWHQVEG